MAGFGMKIFSAFLVAVDATPKHNLHHSPRHNLHHNLHAQKTAYNDSLPPTEELMAAKNKVFRNVTSSIGAFQQRMLAVRAEKTQAVEKQRASYDMQLMAQDAFNKKQLKLNEAIGQSVEAYRTQNRMLREQAQSLSNANNNLGADIQAMKSNVTLAEEFATKTLRTAKQRLDNASALTVLTELDQADDVQRREESHQRKLNYIGDTPDSFVALQVKAALEPKELLQSLLFGLDDLKNEQDASEVNLKQHFTTSLQKLLDDNNSIMDQQAALNESEFKEKSLNERLHNAVGHLEDTHQLLSSRAEALRTFSMRLGAMPMPSAAAPNTPPPATPISLLQINEEANHIPGLPAVKKVMEKPVDVMKTMTSNVQALQQRMVEVQDSSEHAFVLQQHKYEEALSGQHAENYMLETVLNPLALEVKALQSSNLGLRSHSMQLASTCIALRSIISNLMQNITTAQEVAARALANAEQNLHNSSELKVLIELDSIDQASAEDELHKSRLQAMDSGHEVAMMQVKSGPKQSAEELLVMMTSTLTDLAVEQNASLTSLKLSFGEESRKNEACKQALLDEIAKLNASKLVQQKRNDRLSAAALHLEQLHDRLTQQKKALQSFLVVVGGVSGDKEERGNQTEKAAEENKEMSKSSDTAIDQTSHQMPKVLEIAQEKIEHFTSELGKKVAAARKVTSTKALAAKDFVAGKFESAGRTLADRRKAV